MLAILVFLAMVSYLLYKDLLNPTFLICLSWGYSLFMFNFLDGYNIDSIYIIYILFGVFLFQITYYMVDLVAIKRKNDLSVKKSFILTDNVKRFIYIEIIIVAIYGYYLYQVGINNYLGDMYQSLKKNSNELGFTGIGYLWNFIKIFSGVVFYYYLTKRFNYRYLVYIQLIIGLLVALYSMGRSSIFMYIIMIMMIYLSTLKLSNIKLIRIFLTMFTISVVFFSYYSSIKYSYLINDLNFMGSLSIMFKNLVIYSSGSLVAFSNWAADISRELYYGDNFFRFFYAILNFVGFDIYYNPLVQEFIPITNEYSTNVYTFYHYYAADFGLLFALVIQMILGVIYAVVYKKHKQKNEFFILLYALLTYPLLMQFFQDQYVSLTSTWIQNLFILFIIFKLKIFIKYN